ncbi:hypothetical protein LTR17_023828 [Elasticomyces elasticus]|nr:hypothetical protein LTR17_023828 [Elasticomyces elasticus]
MRHKAPGEQVQNTSFQDAGIGWPLKKSFAALPDVLDNPSPVAFIGCSVIVALLVRLYAWSNRADEYQHWFVLGSVLCWLVICAVTEIDFVSGILCVLPWTALASLLLSDAVHATGRRLSPAHPITVVDDYGRRTEKQEKLSQSPAG